MELYVLDDLLRRETVVDRFISLIWTERYTSAGDFELKIESTRDTKLLFIPDIRLAITDSYRVMVVDYVSDDEDDSGARVLTVKGSSIELSSMDNRVAAGNLDSSTADHTWTLVGTPADIARGIFRNICINGKLSSADILPFIQAGSLFAPGTLDESDTIITVVLDPVSVYTAIKNLCETYGFGFRLVRNFDASQLYFDIYTGNDLTTNQNNFNAVVFSPSLDNLSGISEFNANTGLKNVAYVISPAAVVVVYAPDVDPTIAGFQRRVILVDANDVTAIGPTSNALLQQKGADALAATKTIRAFDGQISQYSQYRYGVDYNLGDLIEMRDFEGSSVNMRVTEHIYVSDEQGDRSYPTIAVETFVYPGTWDSWDYDQTWDEATGTWVSLGGSGSDTPVNNAPPAPGFTIVRSTDKTTVQVDASTSLDTDGRIVDYEWVFGDGGTAIGITAVHTYDTTGTYGIQLTVTDEDGASSSLTKTITVSIDTTTPPANVPPTPNFTIAKSTDGKTVQVDGTSSFDSDGSIVGYGWNFGDGFTLTGTDPTVSHTYTANGTYEIVMTVKDDDGVTAAISKFVTITIPVTPPSPTAPVADFTAVVASNGRTVNYTAS